MASIVLELQQLASDPKATVTDVLRKALIVATKLKIGDFREWIEGELGGYEGKDVPPHRKVPCSVMVMYAGRGWVPLHMTVDNEITREASILKFRQDSSQIEALANGKDDVVAFAFGNNIQQYFQKTTNMTQAMLVGQVISRTAVSGVISQIKTIILQWSLRLEEQGILGEGMTFTEKEKQAAAHSTVIHIGNLTGQFRQYSDSTDNSTNNVNINTSSAFDALRAACDQIADQKSRADALARIAELEKSKDKATALANVGLVAGLASNGINIANAIAINLPLIMAWIESLPKHG